MHTGPVRIHGCSSALDECALPQVQTDHQTQRRLPISMISRTHLTGMRKNNFARHVQRKKVLSEKMKETFAGYKQYKRWETHMEPRVYPSGDITLPSTNHREFETYLTCIPEQYKNKHPAAGFMDCTRPDRDRHQWRFLWRGTRQFPSV